MPSAPGVSSSDAKKLEAKKIEAKKSHAAAAKAKKKAYEARANPETVEELVDVGDLEKEWFKEGEWKPSWGHVEFVSGSVLARRSVSPLPYLTSPRPASPCCIRRVAYAGIGTGVASPGLCFLRSVL